MSRTPYVTAATDPRRLLDLDPVTIRKARSLARKAGGSLRSSAILAFEAPGFSAT